MNSIPAEIANLSFDTPTVYDVKKLNDKLQDDLRKLINEHQARTQMFVESVELSRTPRLINGKISITDQVNIRVKLSL